MKTAPAPQILALLLLWIGADGKTKGPFAQADLID